MEKCCVSKRHTSQKGEGKAYHEVGLDRGHHLGPANAEPPYVRQEGENGTAKVRCGPCALKWTSITSAGVTPAGGERGRGGERNTYPKGE